MMDLQYESETFIKFIDYYAKVFGHMHFSSYIYIYILLNNIIAVSSLESN